MELQQVNDGPPTPEKIWAILENIARRQEEYDRLLKEEAAHRKEYYERRKEEYKIRQEKHYRDFEEIKRIQEATARIIGKLGGRFGEVIEYMVVPNLLDKFHELGYNFTKVTQQSAIKDKKNNFITEIDITLESDNKVMLVEVKSKPSIGDIKEHLERMKKMRRHADLLGDKRKYLGAMAGMITNENERDFSLKNGFFVIEPSGDTFNITEPKGQYQPREW